MKVDAIIAKVTKVATNLHDALSDVRHSFNTFLMLVVLNKFTNFEIKSDLYWNPFFFGTKDQLSDVEHLWWHQQFLYEFELVRAVTTLIKNARVASMHVKDIYICNMARNSTSLTTSVSRFNYRSLFASFRPKECGGWVNHVKWYKKTWLWIALFDGFILGTLNSIMSLLHSNFRVRVKVIV